MKETEDMLNLISDIDPSKIKGRFNKAFRILRQLMVTEADNICGKCHRRHREDKLTIHHIDGCAINWARSNLVVYCLWCHSRSHGRPIRRKFPKPTISKLYNSYTLAHPRVHETKTERFERWRQALEEVRN